jgi:hypothetical protein
MSLEAKLELLTAAVIELAAAIGTMQAPGPVEVTPQQISDEKRASAAVKYVEPAKQKEELPNEQPKSSTSGEQSAPTGESSSPALDYVKDVKPITIRLSKEKGREITIGVLSRFGVKSAQDLDTTQWAEYIAHCKKVLAGGEV